MATKKLSYPLCSVEDVRREIGNDNVKDENDIIDAIGEASDFIRDHVDRAFTVTTYDSGTPLTLNFSDPSLLSPINGSGFLIPGEFTPFSITKLTVDGTELVLGTDYFYNQKESVVHFVGILEKGVILLEGESGYNGTEDDPPTNIPVKVKLACRKLAANLSGLNRKESRGFDGVVTQILDKSVNAEIMSLLSGYKKNLV